MALRPNILTDAALHIAFEASILLQYTDINLYGFNFQALNLTKYSLKSNKYVADGYYKQLIKGFERILHLPA
ncbi:MAG TPA: hypothetical protein VJ695_00390 [Nitrososphaera sp.]|nr:hypothetical protein [Nitrososphaera sp.]